MPREQTTLRLPGELMERLREKAREQGKSFNCLVENILWHWVTAYRRQ